MQPLLIFPCNGNALEALDCLGQQYACAGFVDDTPAKQATIVYGYRVHSRRALHERADASLLAVPGSPQSYLSRRAAIEGLGARAGRFATVVHPSACVSPRATIGYNVLIMAGVVISGGAHIGNHVCILPNTVIHHDAVVGDWSLVGSNVTIAGGAAIGQNCYIGSGTSVINGAAIGDRSLLGLATNAIGSFAADTTVAGHPARVIVQRPRAARAAGGGHD